MHSASFESYQQDESVVTRVTLNPAWVPLSLLGCVFSLQSALTLMQLGQLDSYMISSHVLMLGYGLTAFWLATQQFSSRRRRITIGWGVSATVLFGIAVAVERQPHTVVSITAICLVFLLLSLVPLLAASRRRPVHG